MDLRRHGLKSNSKLQKSNTQQNLHRKKIGKKSKLPTIEERKAGGIYGFLTKKKKLDPLKAQMDFLTSGYIHTHGSGIMPQGARTGRGDRKSSKLEDLQYETSKNQFMK
mmetsp:Transcript_21980/g.19533  ORF Transcript_21980/g.19533 Transcript_21980/m.19533 type:complete len:109 (+) Transcript_21980:37-363(+)